MVDISLPSVVDISAPEEAAQNIQGGIAYDLHPDKFADLNKLLMPDLKAAMTPSDATNTVAKYASQSTQHLSLVKGDGPAIARVASGDNEPAGHPAMDLSDLDKHGFVERQMNYIGSQLKHGFTGNQDTADQVMNKLLFDRSDWNDDKEFKLQVSKMKDGNSEVPTSFKATGLSANEQIFGNGVGGLASMFSDMWNNKGVFGSFMGAGFGIGATKGVPGAIAGTLEGVNAGFAYATFKSTTSSVYNSLDGVDESTKQAVSLGAGVINAAINFGAGKILTKTLPGINEQITATAVKKMMNDPAQGTVKQALIGLGKSMGAMGTAGSLQDAVQTFATSFAKNYKGDENGFSNALIKASSDVAASSAEIARAGAAGAVGAGIAHTVVGGVSKTFPTPEAATIEKDRKSVV